MFLLIEKFSVDESKIANCLNIDKNKLSTYLMQLTNWGIIKRENKKIKVIKDNLHLSSDSNIYVSYRNLMNHFALNKINSLSKEDFYAFNAVITCDKKTNDKIKQKILDFLKEIQDNVKKASSEDVYQICFNFLKWS